MKTNTYIRLYLTPFFLERGIFHKRFVNKIKTHFIFTIFFFENRADCETKWKNIVEPGRPQMTIWHTRIACWISKATNTLSENAKTFVFPLQHWLHEHVEMFHYTNIACRVILHCTSFCIWSLCKTQTILNILCFVFSCLYLLLHHLYVLNDLCLGAFAELRKTTTSFSHVSTSVHQSVRSSVRPSVRPSACYNLVPIGQIFMKFRVFIFF